MGTIKVEGNNNQVYSDIKKSNINNTNQPQNTKTSLWTKIGVIIALCSCLIALIANWDKIVAFFS